MRVGHFPDRSASATLRILFLLLFLSVRSSGRNVAIFIRSPHIVYVRSIWDGETGEGMLSWNEHQVFKLQSSYILFLPSSLR